ncbi:double-stranded RNA-specific editase B2-like isoform X2 [Arctopsyche grandis]|uniref:double-stranded RNA-specific editase B2-like isoform X2 n=1 Tax=Arctopsyche grandis TaxID=121162 RepID=UPI00406DA4C5
MGRKNTRNSAAHVKRYNTTGTFVSSTQSASPQELQQSFSPQSPQQPWPQQAQSTLTEIPLAQENSNLTTLVDNSIGENNSFGSDDTVHKKWMKRGFKISMREKRRRQNKTLRRLITPKNALMVLNELAAGSQQECTVVPDDTFGANTVNRQYIAILNIGGVEYSGKGSTKLMAKNMAAESIIRDMIIKQMAHLPPAAEVENGEQEEKMEINEKDDQSFPMIQLASYALHKLFSEWQTEGYKIPLLNQGKCESPIPAPVTTGTPLPQPKPKKSPILPANPENLHPCTLLSQMRGTLEYALLLQEGSPPNGQIFTMGVNIEGKVYPGKATNKKEARKQAAKKACSELFGIVYTKEEKAMECT